MSLLVYIFLALKGATLISSRVPFWMSSEVQVYGQAEHVIMCCIVCSSPAKKR